ncbi:hypothetical protein A4X13_0g7621 [Tilletia indica]|uniref:Uncharacterized protein n=1 Tax=Tilletia indica TaxID=43049 RepID=A0A177TQV3_9BASI|nr:hypothetical protein A4X13_0g7621 [Tilletia indica]
MFEPEDSGGQDVEETLGTTSNCSVSNDESPTDQLEGDEDDRERWSPPPPNLEDDCVSCTSDADLPVKLPQLGVPPTKIGKLPASVSDFMNDLFDDLAKMFKNSNRFLRKGVGFVYVIVKLASKYRFLKNLAEPLCKRILEFWKTITAREAETGKHDSPGTAASIVLQLINIYLQNYGPVNQRHSYMSTVMRSRSRDFVRSELGRISKDVQKVMTSTQKYLGLGRVGELQQAALDPRSRSQPRFIRLDFIEADVRKHLDAALQQIEEEGDKGFTFLPELHSYLQLGFFARGLNFSSSGVQNTRKRKRDELSGIEHNDGNEHPSALVNSPVSAFASTASEIVEELSPSRLAFTNLAQLNQWDALAGSRFRTMHQTWRSNVDSMLLSFSRTSTALLCFVVLLHQRIVCDAASYLAGVLTATIREENEQDPSVTNRIRLCNALGALAVVLSEEARSEESMRAAEEAIDLLRPIYDAEPSSHLCLMTALKLAYGRSLLRMSDTDSSQTQLNLSRKGYRVVTQAIDLARSAVQADRTDMIAMTMLANTLALKAELCHRLIKVRNGIKTSHAQLRSQTNPWKGKRQEPLFIGTRYVLNKVDDPCGDAEEACKLWDESISIFRALAELNSGLYDALLAEVIQSAAESYDETRLDVSRAKFEEAISIFRRLSESFPNIFDDELESMNFEIALSYRIVGRLEDAEEAFKHMLDLRSADRDSMVNVWRGVDVEGSVLHARAVLCVRLERYEEALAHAENSCAILREINPELPELMEPLSVGGFCKWIMGTRTQEALEDLEESIAAADLHENESDDNPLSMSSIALAYGWLGGVQCALGRYEEAQTNGQNAVNCIQQWLQSEGSKAVGRLNYETYDFVLPHLCVLLAGTYVKAGRFEQAKDTLQLGEDGKGADGPTKKTALLLKAYLLDRDGLEAEAATMKADAEGIPFQGFLEALRL